MTANGTTFACLSGALPELRELGVDLIMAQETHLLGARARAAEAWLAREGWFGLLGDAVWKHSAPEVDAGRQPDHSQLRLEGQVGTSGGVGLLTRPGLGLGRPVWGDLPESCSLFEGRALISIWPPVVAGGLVVVSIYGFTGEGQAKLNKLLWAKVGKFLVQFGRPFLLGGDWQTDPDDEALLLWAGAVDAMVVAPSGSAVSCRSSAAQGLGRTIDFFIISRALSQVVVDCEVLENIPTRPHFPVMITLDASKSVQRCWQRCAPKPFPLAGPFQPQGSDDCWLEVASRLEASRTEATGTREGVGERPVCCMVGCRRAVPAGSAGHRRSWQTTLCGQGPADYLQVETSGGAVRWCLPKGLPYGASLALVRRSARRPGEGPCGMVELAWARCFS